MKTIIFSLTIILQLLMFTACKKDKDPVIQPPPVVNQSEITTTLKLIFVDSSNTSNIKYATFRDPDGDGGASHDIFDTIKLQANKTWITSVVLLNETVSPADTISKEVLEEANDHLICFTPAGVSAVVLRTDVDGNGHPVGLKSKWKTSAVGNGSMQIQLKHQPGIKDGTCGPGDTDIDVTFNMKVQ